MPGIVQGLAQFLPLTHAVALIRPLSTGVLPGEALGHLLVLFAYTVGNTLLAVTFISRRLTR
jgi:lipooligosaccharide transport system permease protein